MPPPPPPLPATATAPTPSAAVVVTNSASVFLTALPPPVEGFCGPRMRALHVCPASAVPRLCARTRRAEHLRAGLNNASASEAMGTHRYSPVGVESREDWADAQLDRCDRTLTIVPLGSR